jgi:hypothetical protein
LTSFGSISSKCVCTCCRVPNLASMASNQANIAALRSSMASRTKRVWVAGLDLRRIRRCFLCFTHTPISDL